MRKTGGTGLGLSIAARAVRLHGGNIKAFNASDNGLIVEIRMPLSKAVGSELTQHATISSQQLSSNVST
ncbi:MAG: ATP-binding protein [Pyrinomonadaceae bacterium]